MSAICIIYSLISAPISHFLFIRILLNIAGRRHHRHRIHLCLCFISVETFNLFLAKSKKRHTKKYNQKHQPTQIPHFTNNKFYFFFTIVTVFLFFCFLLCPLNITQRTPIRVLFDFFSSTSSICRFVYLVHFFL